MRSSSGAPPAQALPHRPASPVLVAASGGGLVASAALGSLAAIGALQSWQALPARWWQATASADLLSDALTVALGSVGTGLAAWYALSCLALLLAGLTKSPRLLRGVGRWGAPWLRRLARGLTVGALATATWLPPALAQPDAPEVPEPAPALTWPLTRPVAAAPALAWPTTPPAPASTPPVLTWPSAAPDHAPRAADQSPPAAAQPAASAPPAVLPVHVVQPGDTLWHIAAHRLPATATATEIDAAWRLVYAANQTQVGPDPDFLLPGQSLTIPKELTP